MDRSVFRTGAGDAPGNRVVGRPIGLLMAWLKLPPTTRSEHIERKSSLWKVECFEERRQAREELWGMRHANPDILELFSCEREELVPADFSDAHQLWEPQCVF